MANSNDTKLTPCFIVYVNGTRFSAEQEADVKEIVISDRIDSSSVFTITMSDMKKKWIDYKDFSEGTKVSIWLGYKDAVVEVLEGEITGIYPRFQKNSDSQIIIKGNDYLQRMDRGSKTKSFANMKESDVVKKIIKDAGLEANIPAFGSKKIFTVQNNKSDLDYIQEIAFNNNYIVTISKKKVAFKTLAEMGKKNIIVEWGKTLIEFFPKLDLNPLVSKVEVRGWDNLKGAPVVGKATTDNIKSKIGGSKVGAKKISSMGGEASFVIIDNEVIDQKSAEKLAQSFITNNSMEYIAGKGACQGDNRIIAGSIIEIKELGKKFSGKYLVDGVTHRFIANYGYTTHFEVSRNCSN